MHIRTPGPDGVLPSRSIPPGKVTVKGGWTLIPTADLLLLWNDRADWRAWSEALESSGFKAPDREEPR